MEKESSDYAPLLWFPSTDFPPLGSHTAGMQVTSLSMCPIDVLRVTDWFHWWKVTKYMHLKNFNLFPLQDLIVIGNY